MPPRKRQIHFSFCFFFFAGAAVFFEDTGTAVFFEDTGAAFVVGAAVCVLGGAMGAGTGADGAEDFTGRG